MPAEPGPVLRRKRDFVIAFGGNVVALFECSRLDIDLKLLPLGTGLSSGRLMETSSSSPRHSILMSSVDIDVLTSATEMYVLAEGDLGKDGD